MQERLSEALIKTATRWLACFLIIGGFMVYHSAAPWVTILVAGLATLIIMEAMTYYEHIAKKPK